MDRVPITIAWCFDGKGAVLWGPTEFGMEICQRRHRRVVFWVQRCAKGTK
jgi:hypothetical protein